MACMGLFAHLHGMTQMPTFSVEKTVTTVELHSNVIRATHVGFTCYYPGVMGPNYGFLTVHLSHMNIYVWKVLSDTYQKYSAIMVQVS